MNGRASPSKRGWAKHASAPAAALDRAALAEPALVPEEEPVAEVLRDGPLLDFSEEIKEEYKAISSGSEKIESITVNGWMVVRRPRRKARIDDDFPFIAERYRPFQCEHSEPGT